MEYSLQSIKQLINDCVEENQYLEYKSTISLTDSYKKEAVKDVIAMANSDGGVIIYGVKEFDEKEKKHLPEKITPLNRNLISKESLVQVINSNISPRIDGLIVEPIQLEKPDEVLYVVNVPKSNTAHQSTIDFKYYRRYNFEVLPMFDYEIRDVMNRAKHPVIEPSFEIIIRNQVLSTLAMPGAPHTNRRIKTQILTVSLKNFGSVYANYVNYYLRFDERIIKNENDFKKLEVISYGYHKVEFYDENTIRDIVGFNSFQPYSPKYGPSRFDPILPGMNSRSSEIELTDKTIDLYKDEIIEWEIYADNAPVNKGEIRLGDIKVIEENIE
jgi:hypothetical protein